MLDIEALSKEYILEMSDEEVFLWADAVQKHEAAKKYRQQLLDIVEAGSVDPEVIKFPNPN